MSRITLTSLTLTLVLFLGNSSGNYAAQSTQKPLDTPSGTFQKMIVENASVTMQLDLNGLNGSNSLVARPVPLHFSVAANSFFPILVFNEQLRAVQPGSMALIPSRDGKIPALPVQLAASLKQFVVEKLPSGRGFDLAVSDSNTGFTFFNIQGHQYDYDPVAKSLAISGGRLLISKELAKVMGRPSDAGSEAGTISVGAVMQPIEITQVANGQPQSMVMPPLRHAVSPGLPDLVPGPDVIVGDIEDIEEPGSTASQVGLDVGTDSCNNGDQPLDWFALPATDHPVVPQNLYRMSGGTNNNERFEQIGQSWMKHTFLALEESVCNTCNTSGCQTGTHLCPGCSDPYCCGLNGEQGQLGSRAWLNPFTGSFPSTANNHDNPPHTHDGVSHRIRVNITDLNQSLNQGSSYFAEAAYIAPSEYTWCQSHPDQCNMYNNVSYRKFSVTGNSPPFSFGAVGSTVRMEPAIMAWTGATLNQYQPDPGTDGIWFMGYKVTNPTTGVWHYEYALYNENLDRAIQSFSVPVGTGVTISNIGFHAPPQEPGWANDGTFNSQGYSSTPWSVQAGGSLTWSCETFAQNQNANAIRFGTLYNFRFDANQPPQTANATVGFFKTGSPMTVGIQAPAGGGTATPTPTATATATATTTPTATATTTATATATPIASATPTSTPTATAAPTLTPTATPTPTATSTPRVTPTPRSGPSARPRPTPAPRP